MNGSEGKSDFLGNGVFWTWDWDLFGEAQDTTLLHLMRRSMIGFRRDDLDEEKAELIM